MYLHTHTYHSGSWRTASWVHESNTLKPHLHRSDHPSPNHKIRKHPVVIQWMLLLLEGWLDMAHTPCYVARVLLSETTTAIEIKLEWKLLTPNRHCNLTGIRLSQDHLQSTISTTTKLNTAYRSQIIYTKLIIYTCTCTSLEEHRFFF